MKIRKMWLQKSIMFLLLVLFSLGLAWLSGRLPFVSFGGNTPENTDRPVANLADLQSFSFYTSGMMKNSGRSYSARVEGDKALLCVRPENAPDEVPFETDLSFMQDLKEIIITHNLLAWDGFDKADKNVLDGESFGLSFVLTTGEIVSACGYMFFPKNYGEVSGELDRLFMLALENVKPLCDLQEISFRYGLYDGTLIEAQVTGFGPFGAQVAFTKQKGASRRDEIQTREASFYIDEQQVEELRQLLLSLDMPMLNTLRRDTYGYGAGVHLKVQSGYKTYYIDQLTKFPKQVPPLSDVVYVPLYNHFNKLSMQDAALAEIELDMLLDPFLDPVNNPRTVLLYGKERSLVPGTGYADGYRATVDYEGKQWWVEENFVGRWLMTEEDKLVSDPMIGEKYYMTNKSAELVILEDGTGTFTLDGAEHDIKLSEDFIYHIGGGFSTIPKEGSGGQWRGYDMDYFLDPYYGPHDEAHFNRIRVYAEGMPPPEQKDVVCLLLTRQK